MKEKQPSQDEAQEEVGWEHSNKESKNENFTL